MSLDLFFVFLFCFFLRLFSGQQSCRDAFLRSKAHVFQHFRLADYAAVAFGQLVERFVIVFLQACHAVAEGEESVGETYNLFV